MDPGDSSQCSQVPVTGPCPETEEFYRQRQDSSFLHIGFQTGFGSHPTSYTMRIGDSFLADKADYLVPR
jgi:hypothetical protein